MSIRKSSKSVLIVVVVKYANINDKNINVRIARVLESAIIMFNDHNVRNAKKFAKLFL